MDTRTKRPVRTAVSLGLGAALVATAGVVAVTPVVTALASQGTAAKPAAARPAPAALHASVVRTALASAVTPQGALHGVSCADAGCTLTAMGGTVDVKAASGTKTLDVWKFADTTGNPAPAVGASSAGAASAVLEGTVGIPMTITIHNALSLPVGLSIPQLDSESGGQLELHDVTAGTAGAAVVGAAASGADKIYTFTPNRAGTFTYQAALTDNGSRGVAMGLVGALVVRPSSTQPSAKVGAPGADAGAYDGQEDPTAFDDEAVLVYTDVDSAMTGDPVAFNMRDYRPDYHLINGQAYPTVPSIGSAPGNVVMLRVVNGSILEKSPTILGTRFDEFAVGTRPLPTRLSVSGRLVQTGDTFDALVTMPDSPATARYAIYDAPGSLRNGDEITATSANAPALGGGFVFIDSGFNDSGLTGASVKNLAAAGQPGSATSALGFSADLASRDNGVITAAEMYVDSLTTARPIDLGASSCALSCTATWNVDGSVLGPLSSGVHNVWVRAQTAGSAWGPYALIKIRVDNAGPAVTQLTLSDPNTNAKADLDITATLDERTTGGSMVTAGRYWISSATTDTAPGSAAVQGAMTVNGPRLIASGDATIAALMVDPLDPTPATPSLPLVPTAFGNLAEGTYHLYVQGQDDRGTWGAATSATLVIDKTAPVTGTITLDPAATNGVQGSASKPGNVRITATVSDALSAVTAVDGYLDAVKPAGNANGIYFSKVSGTTWTADMPLSWLAGKKTDGPVRVYVVGTDAAGNRGDGSSPATPVTINVDRTKPVVDVTGFSQGTGFATSPPSRTLTFTLNATDVTAAGSSRIVFAEYWVGTGTPTNVTAALGLPSSGPVSVTRTYDLRINGYYGASSVPVTFRVRDAAGNVSQVTRTYLTRPILFANGYEAVAPPSPNPSTTATGWNRGATGAVTFGNTVGNRLAGLQSLRAAASNGGTAARPAAYYAVDLAVPQLAGATMTTLHGSFLVAPRGVATRCLTGTNVNTCAPKPVTIFAGSAGTTFGTTDTMQIQYGRASTTSRTLFRVGVHEASGMVYGAWTVVPTTATFTVTVDWSATGGNARPTVRINNTGLARPFGTASSTNRIRTVGIGVLNTIASANPGQTGYFLFDSAVLA